MGQANSSVLLSQLQKNAKVVGGGGPTGREELIRGIARMMEKMGVKINPADADTAALAVQISQKLNRVRLTPTDTDAQTKMCVGIAQKINESFSENLININEVDKICHRIGEIIEGLVGELRGDLTLVQRELSILVANMEMVDKMIANLLVKFTGEEAALVKQLRINKSNQVEKLKGVLKISKSVESELKKPIDQFQAVKDMKLIPGSSELSKGIQQTLWGIKDLSTVTSSINDQLKTARITMDDFKQAKTWGEIRRLVDSRRDDIAPADYEKFEKAVRNIRNEFVGGD